jgi:Xaa-Pro aminopeptidase
MTSPFQNRRRALSAKLEALRLDCLLVGSAVNWFYLTGFTGEAGLLVVSRSGATLLTDGRFTVQAREETSGARIVVQKVALMEAAGQFLDEARYRRVGFDPTQLTVAQLKMVKRAAGKRCQWIAAPGLVEALRARKEPAEIAAMRKAALLAGEILEGALTLLKPGVRESEVAAEMEYQMRNRGAGGPSFPSIVAFGERSALPHARPTGKRLGKNELVVLDLGVILGHYCSDMTRTVYAGRAPERVRRWYAAVLEAEQGAIAAVGAGATCGEVDAAARGILAGHRLERYFIHSTGHGLGLEVHEEPRVARGQKHRLEAGNVITIEPGVYMPGVGGIRIEDDVAVHADRSEVLTRLPRDLIEL